MRVAILGPLEVHDDGAAVAVAGADRGNRGIDTYPGLMGRLDVLDIDEYPVAGLPRPIYAMFVNGEERLRVYLGQARRPGRVARRRDLDDRVARTGVHPVPSDQRKPAAVPTGNP